VVEGRAFSLNLCRFVPMKKTGSGRIGRFDPN